MDGLFRKLSHDLEDLLGRYRDLPCALDVCGVRTTHSHFQIRRSELQRVVPFSLGLHSPEEDIGQDRHRVSLFDDRLDAGEALLELTLFD